MSDVTHIKLAGRERTLCGRPVARGRGRYVDPLCKTCRKAIDAATGGTWAIWEANLNEPGGYW